MCVNYLSAILARAVQRHSRQPWRLQGDQLRLVVTTLTFEKLLDQAFDQIRLNADDNVAILIRQLHSLNTLAALNRSASRHRAILKHVRLVVEVADRTLTSPFERVQAEAYMAGMRAVWGDGKPDCHVSCLETRPV